VDLAPALGGWWAEVLRPRGQDLLWLLGDSVLDENKQDENETKSSSLPGRLEVWGIITSFQQGPHLPTTFSDPHQDSARVYVGPGEVGSTGTLVKLQKLDLAEGPLVLRRMCCVTQVSSSCRVSYFSVSGHKTSRWRKRSP